MLKVYQIETTNACNLTCGFCPKFASWNNRPIGFMEPDLIDLVDWSGTTYTEVQFTGEPTLHPGLREIIQRIKAHGPLVGFSTNGTMLDRLKDVLDLVDVLTVNDDLYRKPVLVGHPNVFVQRLGETKTIEDYSREVPGEVPSCGTPDEYVSIHYNGDVVPCCKDHSGVQVFGNLYRQTFAEIANGEQRAAFLKGLKAKRPNGLCEHCQQANPHEIHLALLKARHDSRSTD